MTGKTSQPQQISGQAGGGDRFHQLAIRHDHRVFRQVVGAVSHVDIHLKQIIGELMGKLAIHNIRAGIQYFQKMPAVCLSMSLNIHPSTAPSRPFSISQ